MSAEQIKDAVQRCDDALDIALRHGLTKESHHQAWVIDQMCRALLGVEYESWVAKVRAGDDGPNTYDWDTGIVP